MTKNDMTFQELMHESMSLYVNHGRLGRNELSDAAEKSIAEEIELLDAFSTSKMSDLHSLLEVAIDPAKHEEAMVLARRFHKLVIDSLQTGTTRK